LTKKTNQSNQSKSKQSKQKDIVNLNKKFYFASANTCFGFTNYFNSIFNPQSLEKIYIIKGILGYGKSYKSYIINEIAQKAADKKYSVECYCNPANPEYLDGITIKELKMAVADGTNPYISDSNYPGIVENIINLGDFCDESKLQKNKKEVFDLTEKKEDCYSSVYKFLKAANELVEYTMGLLKRYINEEKLDSAIDRVLNKCVYEHVLHGSKESKNPEEYRLINTISQSGFNELETFESDAKKIFYISNDHFSGFYYTKKLLEKFADSPGISNLPKVISPDTLNPNRIKAVYCKDSKTLFVIKNKIENKVYDEKYGFINMERFINPELKKEHKQRLKFIQKCYKSIIDAAADYFKEIKNLNSLIDDIYMSSVDSGEQKKYTEMLIEKIIL